MEKLLQYLALACAAFLSVAALAGSERTRYVATLALFYTVSAETQCVFVSAAEIHAPETKLNIRPSKAFLSAACQHFGATWQPTAPKGGTPKSHEAAAWYADTPDLPLYFKDMAM